MSKTHKKKVGYNNSESQYDSISFGEQIFVEEMPSRSIPSDYERIDPSKEIKNKTPQTVYQKNISFDRFLKTSINFFAISAIGFIVYSLFFGALEKSEFLLKPMGRGVGITLGIFAAVSIFTILFLFTKTKIKLFVENGLLHIISFRGLNHTIPVDNIADCKINIFGTADSITTLINSRQYKIDLEAGLLIVLKDGQSLLFASSNSNPANKNLAFN